MSRSPRRLSERGSLQPVAAAMVLVLFAVGLIVLHWGKGVVERWQGLAAAEATALGSLRELQPPAYAPEMGAAAGSPTAAAAWASALAEANGIGRPPFPTLRASDLVVGPTAVQVTVRLRGRVPLTALAVGLPAGRILAGTRRLDRWARVESATGCLPLALDLAALPPGVDSTGEVFALGVSPERPGASVVQLSRRAPDPIAQVSFLGYQVGEPPEGSAPPEVSVGDALAPVPTPPGFLAELDRRLSGRVVIVPMTEGDVVVAFSRLFLQAADEARGVVHVAFASSAVGRGASLGPGVRLATDSVSPRGLVLVARLGG